MQIAVLILACIIAWFIFRTARGYIQRAGQISETIGEQAVLTSQGMKKSYTNSQYNGFADDLYIAMKGIGTDEDMIGNVMSKMQNDLDVIALNNAYGIRDGYDLKTWLRNDLSPSDMNRYVNNILRQKGITKTF